MKTRRKDLQQTEKCWWPTSSKATLRRGSSRASFVKSTGVRLNSVRSGRASGGCALPQTEQARLRELQLRVAQLEAEKRELRNTCRQLEAASLCRDKLRGIAPFGLVTLDARGTNRASAALLGRGKWSLIKEPFVALVVPEDRLIFRRELRRCVRLGVMDSDELSLRSPEGGFADVQFPLFDGEGKIYDLAGVVTDAAERRRLEAEVLQISEREQRRMAQDLHDGLGQHLTGIAHLAAVLHSKLAEQALPEAADAARVARLLDHAVTQTRTLARGLLAVQLEAGGLMSALEQLAAIVRDLFNIDCCFECPQPVSIQDNAIATHLYRIAQEAVNNAIKHGRASQIKIELLVGLEIITLMVQNNGLVVSKSHSCNDGIGLRIMRYRAKLIGGSLTLHSDAERGTTVVCSVHQPAALPEPSSSP
jgi:signal transduction histidine kinase